MEFFEKQFYPDKGYILVPTGIYSLSTLIRLRLQLLEPFAIYQGDSLEKDDAPIVGHAGEYRQKMLAPILSHPDNPYMQDETGRNIFMLDPDENEPKIIRVPTGIPLIGMRDSYRYHFAMNKFFTNQTVEQILEGLKKDGWTNYIYDKQNIGPMDFTPIAELRTHVRKIA